MTETKNKPQRPALVKIDAKVPPWMRDALVQASRLLGVSAAEILRSAMLDYLRRTVPGTVPQYVPQYGLGLETVPQYPPNQPAATGAAVPGTVPQYGPQYPPSDGTDLALKILREEKDLREEREREDQRGPSTGPSEPGEWIELAAELITAINSRAGLRLRTDDPRAQQALHQRLTGAGLAPDDAGPATVEQVRETVEACASQWQPRMLSLTAILGPKFWDHHGRAAAPIESRRKRGPVAGGCDREYTSEEWFEGTDNYKYDITGDDNEFLE